MYRSIRINDNVYQTLRYLQRPRESYGDVISRVISACPPDALKRDAPGQPEFGSLGDVLVGSGAGKGKDE